MNSAFKSGSLPLVGRSAELAELRGVMDTVERGSGCTWLVTGEGGVGKTRLGRAAMEEAGRRDWYVAAGRAFAVESGVPYALFADALLPVVRRLDEDSLTVLTRGVDELTWLFRGSRAMVQPAPSPDRRTSAVGCTGTSRSSCAGWLHASRCSLCWTTCNGRTRHRSSCCTSLRGR
jgi:hypothetical protein